MAQAFRISPRPIFLLVESGEGLVPFSCLALPPCHQSGTLAEVLTNGC